MNNGIHPEGPADGVEASDAEAPRPSSEPVAGLKGAPTSLVEEMTVETSASGPSPLRASEAPVPLPGPPAAPEAPLVPSVSVSSDEDLLVPASASPPSRGQRTHVAPAQVLLERVDDDPTFRIRPEGDLSPLATDLARLGQLYPIDVRLRPPDRYQVVSGFRRVAALKFLQRDRVLARIHADLSDEDALLMALAASIHSAPASHEELEGVKARWEAQGLLSAAARDMLDKALQPEDMLAPETVNEDGVEEVDADDLADQLTLRIAEVNQDLSALADAFGDLEEKRRDALLEQLRYASDLVAYLEGR